VAELEGIEGAQTHRSWWVAKAAVRDAKRGDGRATLTLAVAGGRGLLDHGGVLLGGLVHLVHGAVDLVQAGRLFGGRGGDLGDDALMSCTPAMMRAGPRRSRRPGSTPARRPAGSRRDQGLDLLGRVGRALGQGPHFLGDDREAATASPARAASTPAFRASRLVWKAISSITPMMAPISRELLSIWPMAATARSTIWPPFSASCGRVDRATGAGALGGAADGGGDLVQRGGGFFQAGGLLLGAARQVVGGVADLARAGLDAADRAVDHAHGLGQLVHGRVEVGLQLAIGGREGLVQAEGQVAGGQGFQALADPADDRGLLAGVGLALDLAGFADCVRPRRAGRRRRLPGGSSRARLP
jgi:hypothetical protein